ncbi:MAG: acyl-CoA dehydratase activase [bacterium]
MIGCGIDIGSRATKIVLFDADQKKIRSRVIADTQLHNDTLINELMDKSLLKAQCAQNDITRVIATGYGRELVSSVTDTVTEITCHARGVQYFYPEVRTVIEIGGQDSKITKLNDDRKIKDFAMNDRCAAGTGRFLEVAIQLLDIDIADVKELIAQSTPAAISSTCVVFAESEIIGLLSQKVNRGDIIAGVQKAIASRVMGLSGRKLVDPVVFTGGVALIPGMDDALAKECSCSIRVSEFPQYTGALGAAIIATED